MLLGSELSFKVMIGDLSNGGGGVGALGGGWKSDNLFEMNFDNFASLCSVEASSEANVGLDWVKAWLIRPLLFSLSSLEAVTTWDVESWKPIKCIC